MNRSARSRHSATSPAIQIGTNGGPSMMIRNGHMTMCTTRCCCRPAPVPSPARPAVRQPGRPDWAGRRRSRGRQRAPPTVTRAADPARPQAGRRRARQQHRDEQLVVQAHTRHRARRQPPARLGALDRADDEQHDGRPHRHVDRRGQQGVPEDHRHGGERETPGRERLRRRDRRRTRGSAARRRPPTPSCQGRRDTHRPRRIGEHVAQARAMQRRQRSAGRHSPTPVAASGSTARRGRIRSRS